MKSEHFGGGLCACEKRHIVDAVLTFDEVGSDKKVMHWVEPKW